VDRLILKGDSSEKWQKEQLNDQIVSIFLQGKKRNCRLNWEVIVAREISFKIY